MCVCGCGCGSLHTGKEVYVPSVVKSDESYDYVQTLMLMWKINTESVCGRATRGALGQRGRKHSAVR